MITTTYIRVLKIKINFSTFFFDEIMKNYIPNNVLKTLDLLFNFNPIKFFNNKAIKP